MEPLLKAKRGLCGTALQVLDWKLEYHVLHFLQGPFTYVFWLIERRKARLRDLLANEERER